MRSHQLRRQQGGSPRPSPSPANGPVEAEVEEVGPGCIRAAVWRMPCGSRGKMGDHGAAAIAPRRARAEEERCSCSTASRPEREPGRK